MLYWKDCKTDEELKQWFDNYYDTYCEHEEEPTLFQVHATWERYGGPEEGGWWYTCGEPVANYCFFSKQQAFECLRIIKQEFFSEDTEEEYDFNLARAYGEFYPKRRPHYE